MGMTPRGTRGRETSPLSWSDRESADALLTSEARIAESVAPGVKLQLQGELWLRSKWLTGHVWHRRIWIESGANAPLRNSDTTPRYGLACGAVLLADAALATFDPGDDRTCSSCRTKDHAPGTAPARPDLAVAAGLPRVGTDSESLAEDGVDAQVGD